MGRLAVIYNLRASRGRDRGRAASTMLDALRRGPGPVAVFAGRRSSPTAPSGEGLESDHPEFSCQKRCKDLIWCTVWRCDPGLVS